MSGDDRHRDENFANPTGKQLYLHPEETGLKMSESDQMIELSDARGVDIGGTMKVGIYAADEIKIEGRCIKIDTPKAVQWYVLKRNRGLWKRMFFTNPVNHHP